MAITLSGDTGITTPMYNGTISANAVTPSVSMKNRIINGAMVIDQRNAGASVTPSTTASTYTLDRWFLAPSVGSKVSIQQVTTAPTGFNNSLKVTSLAATTVGASDYYEIYQAIEGYNISDLGWGTANAKTVTLSFQVYSSLTGTFGGSLLAGGAADVTYPFTYTVSSANTWTPISVTIAGPTSGTFGTTNGVGVYVGFSLGAGSSASTTANAWATGFYRAPTGAVQVVATNGATFYITGVQLEVGSSATSFDYRQYGQELALCQRYYEQINLGTSPSSTQNQYLGIGTAYASNDVRFVLYYQNKRTNPSVSLASYTIRFGTTNYGLNLTSLLVDGAGPTCTLIYNNSTTGFTEGRALQVVSQAATGTISISAEL